MSDAADTRDRVIALESDMKHLTLQVDAMAEKVAAMHDILQQAKGVRWLIIAAASVGGFVAAKIGMFLPWLAVPPR